MTVRIEGLEETLTALNAEIDQIKGKSIAGLFAGGLIVERKAKQYAPVEYGNLRGSGYTRRAMDDPNAVEVGFEALYALYVHENLEQKLAGQPRPSGLGVYWGPSGARPRFLATALSETSRQVVDMVAAYARQ